MRQIPRRHDLDEIRTVFDLLSHDPAKVIRAVSRRGRFAFVQIGKPGIRAQLLGHIAVTAASAQAEKRDIQSGAVKISSVDASPHIRKPVRIADQHARHAQCRKSSGKRPLRTEQGSQRFPFVRSKEQVIRIAEIIEVLQMDVRIDQPRRNGQTGQIDDLRTFRPRQVFSDFENSVSLYQYLHMRLEFLHNAVEQTAAENQNITHEICPSLPHKRKHPNRSYYTIQMQNDTFQNVAAV